MNKPIGIIGYGYVGRAVERFFINHYPILIHDPPQGKDELSRINEESCCAVICVSTPMLCDGAVDTSIIESVVSQLNPDLLIVIKSAIPPGTTRILEAKTGARLVVSPEYIGEGGYPIPYWKDMPHATDMSLHSFHIFGGNPDATREAICVWKSVAGAHARYIQTNSTTAEVVKYMENSWIGTKVTFCNEFYDISKAFGVDYNEVRELWLLDGRVGRSHTLVHEDKRGFNGKCVPKDTSGILRACEAVGINPRLLRAVLESNAERVK